MNLLQRGLISVRRHRRGCHRGRRVPLSSPPTTRRGENRASRWLVEEALRWLLDRPAIDRALLSVLRHPRALLVVASLIGLCLTAWSLASLFTVTSPPQAAAAPDVGRSSGIELAAVSTGALDEVQQGEREVLAVISAYNQASITAGVLGEPAHMAPYLAPEGAAWHQVDVEYQRREGRGETTDAALNRWGVLRIEVQHDTALVETQEQWDVVTSVGGEVISSRRGVLSRNSYQLRRSASGQWLIVAIETTPLVA